MLDDFRKQADSSSFFNEEEPETPERQFITRGQFLGMTPFQRFLVAILLLLITILLTSFCLLATGRVVLPYIS
jgi:hypothetical protein